MKIKKIFADGVYSLIQFFKTIFMIPRGVCKFEPTCSSYAREAIIKLPIYKAVPKICWRVLRCNPFSKGGLDPVLKS